MTEIRGLILQMSLANPLCANAAGPISAIPPPATISSAIEESRLNFVCE
jgi:hypothetical protein